MTFEIGEIVQFPDISRLNLENGQYLFEDQAFELLYSFPDGYVFRVVAKLPSTPLPFDELPTVEKLDKNGM